MWSDKSQVEGIIPSFDVLVLILLMQPKRLLCLFAAGHCWLMLSLLSRRPQGPFPQTCSPAFSPQPVSLQGVLPPQVQEFACVLYEFHKTPVSPFLQPIYVLLEGGPALEHLNWCSQFGVIYRLDENTLWCLLQISGKDNNKTGPRTDSCDTPLITNLQVDNDSLTTVLWAQSWNPFYTRMVVHPFRP